MTRLDRQTRAQVFRKKSTESLEAAKRCLDSKQYRSTCNRAYYAVYQLLNAALFEKTSDEPRSEDGRQLQNWEHWQVGELFQKLVNLTNVPISEKYEMAAFVKQLLKYRTDADYRIPEDSEITATCANKRYEQSVKVCDTIFQIIGKDGNENRSQA